MGSSNIAYMYEEGKGVAKNYKKAAAYYELAVEQGENDCLLDLSRLFGKGGFGLNKNTEIFEQFETRWNELQ